ncbi:CDGSH iron-sulfur domain-containing protein 3, mitochondrial isoform X3 [Tamandua tetradactyla]|uniref:CDGSH iron-sulfur domain-containing protein 3, mitochondrial isoform X3 n=1 Tax=Tamandua tetradactyla TaxID=48850 RepID=UPI00405388C5
MGSAALILRPAARGAWKLNQRQYISSWLAQWFPKTPAKSVVALKTPIKVELVAGKTYRWCVCGRSKKQVASGPKVPGIGPKIGKTQPCFPAPKACQPFLYPFPVLFSQKTLSLFQFI